MSQLKPISQAISAVGASATAAATVEDVVNVSMDFFRKEVSKVTESSPTKIKHIIKFSDDVNNSKYAALLKQSYYLKQYFEHNYDVNGHDKAFKRFFGKITVTITDSSVTLSEKRKLFSKNIHKTYKFDNNADREEFEFNFALSDNDIPSGIDDNIFTYTGVQIAGGSVLKAVLRGDTYIDKYFDRVEKKIKSRFV